MTTHREQMEALLPPAIEVVDGVVRENIAGPDEPPRFETRPNIVSHKIITVAADSTAEAPRFVVGMGRGGSAVLSVAEIRDLHRALGQLVENLSGAGVPEEGMLIRVYGDSLADKPSLLSRVTFGLLG